jgi:hypothetical protein
LRPRPWFEEEDPEDLPDFDEPELLEALLPDLLPLDEEADIFDPPVFLLVTVTSLGKSRL